jgi:hypothetical protein
VIIEITPEVRLVRTSLEWQCQTRFGETKSWTLYHYGSFAHACERAMRELAHGNHGDGAKLSLAEAIAAYQAAAEAVIFKCAPRSRAQLENKRKQFLTRAKKEE